MMDDPIWRQFLLFCLRNGMWYGEKVDEENCLDELLSSSIVNCQIRPGCNGLTLSEVQPNYVATKQSVIFVSSLERQLKNGP
jgi:hypothetical protein